MTLRASVRSHQWFARGAAWILFGGVVSVTSASARADDKEACANSYEHAQKLKREGKLKDAKSELVFCGSEKCPALLVPYCVQMLHDVDETMPTLIVVAHGPKGVEVDAVRVLIDGKVAAEKLDGRPIATDPGKHHMRYELAGVAAVEEDIIVNEGEHGRRLEPSFGTGEPAVPPSSSTTPRTSASPAATTESSGPGKVPGFVLIGVGAAGLIAGGVTGGLALSAKSKLDTECKPTKTNCPASAQSDIDKLNTMGIGSTVGFAAGGAVAVVGVVLAAVLPAHHAGGAKAARNAVPHIEPWVTPFGAGARGTF